MNIAGIQESVGFKKFSEKLERVDEIDPLLASIIRICVSVYLCICVCIAPRQR